MKKRNEEEVLHRMAAYCSGVERCVLDVEKKLQSFDLPDESCNQIINRLVKEKFIDESRFAKAFVNDKLRFNQWGRIRLNYELQKKKIPSAIRLEALAGIDESVYLSILETLLKAKSRTIKGGTPRDKYYKLLRYGAGRGFETELIRRVVQSITNSHDDFDDLD